MIALFQPEIPQNTGTIIRTCACFHIHVHLIEPLGFSMSDKYLKRSAMDYHELAYVKRHPSWEDFVRSTESNRLVLVDVKGESSYIDFAYRPHDLFIFGKESSGIPKSIFDTIPNRISIPMQAGRSLNLAISVAMIISQIQKFKILPETIRNL
jgi:tRNA (cytidine/uridine-2'-O-)-methyltransferase